MRSFFGGFGLVLVFLYLILVAYLTKDVLAKSTQNNVNVAQASIQDLSSYFAQKGDLEKNPSLSFNEISQTSVVVLGTTNKASPSPGLGTSPTATPSSNQLNKPSLTIALLGDSMIDTLGSNLPHLAQELKQRFPKTQFNLLNYGAGATDMEYGLNRLTNGYNYLGESKPSLLSQNPDIMVVESFAYNHWTNTQADLDRQWLTIAKIIDTIKKHNSNTKIILAATIAPYCPTYTDGSANLPPDRKYVECETVKAYLQNMVNFASSQGYPLADAYHSSLAGSDGNPKYINQSDHIHPSDAGKQLFAKKVADALQGLIP